MGKVLQARSTMHAKSKLMPSSSRCQVQNDVKCNTSNLYCKLLSWWASRRCRTRRRSRRGRGVTPTGSLSRLCQTPSGSVILCCGTARQHVLLLCSYPMSHLSSSDPQLRYNTHPSSPVFASLPVDYNHRFWIYGATG